MIQCLRIPVLDLDGSNTLRDSGFGRLGAVEWALDSAAIEAAEMNRAMLFASAYLCLFKKDPSLDARVKLLARSIAGKGAGSRRLDRARRIAEAEIDVLRVGRARCSLRSAVDDLNCEPPNAQKSRELGHL
jgi:hypothetical protein